MENDNPQSQGHVVKVFAISDNMETPKMQLVETAGSGTSQFTENYDQLINYR